MATRLVLFWLFVAAGLLVGVQSASAQHYNRIAIAGAYEGGPAFDLVIRCSPYSPRRRAGVTHFWGGDSPNFTPQYVVSDISLKLDQHRIAIPRDAFADLGDVLVPTVNVDADTRDVHIDWSGGDAAGSYRVVFTFRHYRLVQREVFAYLAKEPSEVRRFP
jgi:hypothetical protein